MTRPARQPSKPLSPSFPKPASTRPSGSAPGSRRVRPAWFSKPASVRFSPGSSSHSISTSPIMRRSPATVSSGRSPMPGMSSPWKPR